MKNLFLIFKTYLTHKEVLLKNLYVIGDSDEHKSAIFHHIKLKKLEKMSYIDFVSWYDEIFANDYEYLTSYKYYGFRFIFYKESEA